MRTIAAYLAIAAVLAGGVLLPREELHAQEVLKASKVEARSGRHRPSLGLPLHPDGQIDHAVWHSEGLWMGADIFKGTPHWMMASSELCTDFALKDVLSLCAQWAGERPKGAPAIVWGPYGKFHFVAICKKANSSLGWKSIGFIIPKEGIAPGKSVYDYSLSVNALEHRISYNLFPKLPAHLQEIIEEMTAHELLCPYQEFDAGELDEAPEREVEMDMEIDYLEQN